MTPQEYANKHLSYPYWTKNELAKYWLEFEPHSFMWLALSYAIDTTKHRTYKENE